MCVLLDNFGFHDGGSCGLMVRVRLVTRRLRVRVSDPAGIVGGRYILYIYIYIHQLVSSSLWDRGLKCVLAVHYLVTFFFTLLLPLLTPRRLGERNTRSLTFCLETKMPWHRALSRKKKAVVFTTVTANAYQDQINTGFSKVCEIFKVCGIESLKYVREFHTPVCYCGDISTLWNVTLNETNCDWLFDMSVKRPHGWALANESYHTFQTFSRSVANLAILLLNLALFRLFLPKAPSNKFSYFFIFIWQL